VTAFNIHATPTDAMATLANPFVSIPESSNGSLDAQNAQTLKGQVAQLGLGLQLAASMGYTQVVVQFDKTDPTKLEYVVIKPLPAGMSVSPGGDLSTKSLNPKGDQLTVSQNSVGGVQLTEDGNTVSFAPRAIRSVDLNPGAGKNTEKVLSLPAFVNVNVTLAGDNDVSVGSSTNSLDGVAGPVHILTPTGARHGKTTLTVDDSADGSTGQNTTINDTSVTVGQAQVTYTSGVSSLKVLGGSGIGNFFQVDATSAATPVTISTGAGTNWVFVGALAHTFKSALGGAFVTPWHSLGKIAGAVHVQPTTHSKQLDLTVDDSFEKARNLTVTNNTISFAGVAPITYSGASSLNLVEGPGKGAAVAFQGPASSTPVTLYDAQSDTVTVGKGWHVQQVSGFPRWDASSAFQGPGLKDSKWIPISAQGPWQESGGDPFLQIQVDPALLAKEAQLVRYQTSAGSSALDQGVTHVQVNQVVASAARPASTSSAVRAMGIQLALADLAI
jgi:hypothetical protein